MRNKEKPEKKREHRIAELEKLNPKTLTVQCVIEKYEEYKAHKLETFILIERIEAASFGWSISTTLGALLDMDESVKFPGFHAKIVPKIELEDCATVGDVVAAMQAEQAPVFLGFPAMIACWQALMDAKASGCAGLGQGQLPATEFVELAAPLLKKTRGPSSVVSLLPLIDALHASPTLRGMADGLEDVQNRLSLWLQTHRGVYDYLDPHVILVVPAATSVAGMANFVADLPALPGGPIVAQADSVGNRIPWMYQAPTAAGMSMAAASFRAQLAHPEAPLVGAVAPVGGGAGPRAVIALFSTGPGAISVI